MNLTFIQSLNILWVNIVSYQNQMPNLEIQFPDLCLSYDLGFHQTESTTQTGMIIIFCFYKVKSKFCMKDISRSKQTEALTFFSQKIVSNTQKVQENRKILGNEENDLKVGLDIERLNFNRYLQCSERILCVNSLY